MAEGDISKKSGPELFKELLRLYPTAEVEDYYKGATWKDDIMRVDIGLLDAHRREGGAPDPLPLSKVVMPAMPAPMGMARPGGLALPAGIAAARTLTGSTSTSLLKPQGVVNQAAPPAGGTPGVAAELRLIALFVAKWKLEPSRTKIALARLPPTRRRFVITAFKVAPGGVDPTAQLQLFITNCEKKGTWGPPALGSVAPTASAGLGASTLGVKRPLTGPLAAAADPSKRARLLTNPAPALAAARQHSLMRPTAGQAGQGTTTAMSPLAARIAAVRAQQAQARPQALARPPMPLGQARPPVRPQLLTRTAPQAYAAARTPSQLVRPTPLAGGAFRPAARPPLLGSTFAARPGLSSMVRPTPLAARPGAPRPGAPRPGLLNRPTMLPKGRV